MPTLRRMRLLVAALLAISVFAMALIVVGSAPRTAGTAAQSQTEGSQPSSAGRKIYSPTIFDDPYVRDQWEDSIQALEKACRDSGAYCDEARQARISLK